MLLDRVLNAFDGLAPDDPTPLERLRDAEAARLRVPLVADAQRVVQVCGRGVGRRREEVAERRAERERVSGGKRSHVDVAQRDVRQRPAYGVDEAEASG